MFQLANASETLQTFFLTTANRLAHKTGFVQRESKVTGAHWIQTLTFGLLDKPDASLNQLSQVSEDLGIPLTAQGVHERMTPAAVDLEKAMFKASLALFRQQQSLPVEILERFSAVELLDSSAIALPDSLKEEFPGCGGSAAKELRYLKMRLRTMLFVPGNRQKMLDKIPTLSADALILDLEDSVPLPEKETARALVREALGRFGGGRIPLFVRTNTLSTGLTSADIEAVVAPGLAGIVYPKAETADDVRTVDGLISHAEAVMGLPAGRLRLVALIETARGVLNAQEIAMASPRLEAVAFGGEDFATDMGLQRTPEATELRHARAHVALAARAAGIGAVDTVCVYLDDDEQLLREARLAKQLGFSGKLAIHPRQTAIISSVFSPTPEEVAYARRVVEAFAAAQASGSAAVALDGKLLDIPVAERYRRLLEAAG